MTIKDYLAGLETALAGLPVTEREDFLREMESHIEGLRERSPGRPEEELVGSLTPPEALAAEILGAARPEGPKAPVQEEPAASWGEGEGRGESRGNQGRSRSGIGERLREALDTLQRLSRQSGHRFHVDIDSIEEEDEETEFERSFDLAEARRVTVEVVSARVTLEEGEGDQVRVRASFSGDSHRRPRDRSGDSHPSRSGDSQANWSGDSHPDDAEGDSHPGSHPDKTEDRLKFTTEGGILRIEEAPGFRGDLEELSLSLPPGVTSVEVKTQSGDVEATDLDLDLEITTASGDIRLEGIGGSALVETASGEVEARSCGGLRAGAASGDLRIEEIEGDVAAITASGDVSLSDVEGNAAVETVSGDIEITGVGKRAGVKTTSGDVSIEDCEGPVAVTTLSGDLEVDASSGFGGLAVSSTSGNIEVTLPSEPEAFLRLRTKSGSISVGGKDGRSGDFALGVGGPELSLASLSGDIEVDW